MSAYAWQCHTCGHLMSRHLGKHNADGGVGPTWPDHYTCKWCGCVVTDDSPTVPLTEKDCHELEAMEPSVGEVTP